jgi:hypothetical protein
MRFEHRTLLSSTECLERLRGTTVSWPSLLQHSPATEDHLARYLKARKDSFRLAGPYGSSILSLYGQLSTGAAGTRIVGRVRPSTSAIFFFASGFAFLVGVLSLMLLPPRDISEAIQYRCSGLWVVFAFALYFHSWRMTRQVARDMITFVERTCAAVPSVRGAV